jgi:hypothetical protein
MVLKSVHHSSTADKHDGLVTMPSSQSFVDAHQVRMGLHLNEGPS